MILAASRFVTICVSDSENKKAFITEHLYIVIISTVLPHFSGDVGLL
ncbi:MAG: hypothetical protein SO022_02795 [Selenomonadaceae bacterium]|nr:hypothetical protein [Selenomonadaceae bacterium]